MFSLPDDVVRKPLFTVTDELLQKHIYILYTELEPRNIADVMFQESYISISDHDIVTDFQLKHKRLNSLLDILKKKRLYAAFVCTLEFLNYTVVLNTLKEDRHFICESSKYTNLLSFSLFIFNLILWGFLGFFFSRNCYLHTTQLYSSARGTSGYWLFCTIAWTHPRSIKYIWYRGLFWYHSQEIQAAENNSYERKPCLQRTLPCAEIGFKKRRSDTKDDKEKCWYHEEG